MWVEFKLTYKNIKGEIKMTKKEKQRMRDKEFRVRIGAMIKEAREMRAMKQKNLAKLTDCTASHLSQIENGRSGISLEMLNKLLNALKIVDREPFLNQII